MVTRLVEVLEQRYTHDAGFRDIATVRDGKCTHIITVDTPSLTTVEWLNTHAQDTYVGMSVAELRALGFHYAGSTYAIENPNTGERYFTQVDDNDYHAENPEVPDLRARDVEFVPHVSRAKEK